MGLVLGIDVGTVSLKWTLLGPGKRLEELKDSSGGLIDAVKSFPSAEGEAVAVSRYIRIQGRPLDALVDDLRRLSAFLEPEEIESAVVTGASAKLVSGAIGIPAENEFRAVATGISRLHPDVMNVFEMGGENSKYLRMEGNGSGAGIADFETNGDCAAGTGSFMDQQAGRLCYPVEDIGDIVMAAGRCPKIAGRCSVFAKSDMIHAQQKGYMPGEVLKGLCEAVARNFKSNIVKGRKITGRTAFIGGVAMNSGVAGAIQRVFDIEEKDFVVPEHCSYIGAIGSAILASGNGHLFDGKLFAEKIQGAPAAGSQKFPSLKPLSREKVLFLRDRVFDYSFEGRTLPVDAWLGIDVGSVSTNFALVDAEGSVIREIYLRTRARPIDVVGEGLAELQASVGDKVRIRGVGTTGSGRELIGELVGADTVNDEITAHKTGSDFIGTKLLGREVDTIFEIGGQDSKYICIDDGIVVDFSMNEACAAGTGSFLEEQAQKIDVDIVDEFSSLAFESHAPVRLGERCTVYMEQDISSCMKKGAEKKDLIAGLAYSVVQNYLNRVVRGRRIGKVIFFQGGTAYNDSVAAAFSEVLGREIIVPPYNGVIGAIGSALLAWEKTQALGRESSFRGYDISKIDYSIREFSCKGCTNYCDIQEFTVMGEKTYWGDKCSDKYRKRSKAVVKPVIPDLVHLYTRLLEDDYSAAAAARIGAAPAAVRIGETQPTMRIAAAPATSSTAGKKVAMGIPRSMYYYDRFPFWRTWLEALGVDVTVSPATNRGIVNRGLEETVAEPCCPIQTAHGHVAVLLDEGVDMVFVPNVIDSETDTPEVNSYLCPWAQTLPFVLRGMPSLDGREDRIFAPTVHFREGAKSVEKELWESAKWFGISRGRHRTAVKAAYAAQQIFREKVLEAGKKALRAIEEAGQQGIVIAGRPYNIFDKEINLDVPSKLRDYYGMNVVPIFFLPLDGIDVDAAGKNMFWNYGRRILQAARFVEGRNNLHLIYITNFKCGPDSYIKHFCGRVAGRPWLTLQFDAHGNDAGIMTRCEAYLDSKGVLRWWKKDRRPSMAEPSSSRECRPAEPKLSLRRAGTLG